MDEIDRQLILQFWEIASTISPMQKDVKQRHTWMSTFEEHPTHYLQETKAFTKFFLYPTWKIFPIEIVVI
jgi:hypothetical protein